jgi:beta-galactosidase
VIYLSVFASFNALFAQNQTPQPRPKLRERISFNANWKFYKYDSSSKADDLIYNVRPIVNNYNGQKPADAQPTTGESIQTIQAILKPWILPTGNDYINDPNKYYQRPAGFPGRDFPLVQADFDDRNWDDVTLPHDWAITGPFYQGNNPEVGGSLGRLPSPGVAWYRKKFYPPAEDAQKLIFLEIEGAMSYAMVWINGKLAGGWPYGYTSWQVNLTPYIKPGQLNQLAIRLDNPNYSSRWYTGGGIYRNVWLIKTNPVHIAPWGTFIKTKKATTSLAKVNLTILIHNESNQEAQITTTTSIYQINATGEKTGKAIARSRPTITLIAAGSKTIAENSVEIKNPRFWGPPPTQTPHCYLAVTTLYQNNIPIDSHETRFGIRTLRYEPDSGLIINNELIKIKGVNLHHDLGALGAAFNRRAAERQLELLREMGCNAIRTAHNPPAPELLELTDRLGFLVMEEAFDMWVMQKNPHDFHLIFPDWYEQDLRAMVRRDRNCPSVIIWSIGNEVGEQYTGEEGAALARRLSAIIKEEDPTRPVTCAMNWAKPDMPLSQVLDVISLNYQGEGIRQDPAFEGTDRIRTTPQYAAFHQKFPQKVILSSETASTFSSRGVYLFPVTEKSSDFIRAEQGGDTQFHHVSAYELYAADFGASPDKVFGALESHPFVAGQFVWSGFDYLGEPTPYYEARSSYCGIFDLAGFKKDRFYLYQAEWRPDLPMVHILPHWNWPERIGLVTPVHVFTSGDEAELFLNGKSLGRKTKRTLEYRLRWDDVRYEPGELKAIAYKKGTKWAEEIIKTTGNPAQLQATVDRGKIRADGKDLAFITLKVTDKAGLTVPTATNLIELDIEGPGEIVATDNGDPTDFTPFPARQRQAFNGLALAIVRAKPGASGRIVVTAHSSGLEKAQIIIETH